jgi:UDP-N-acetylmuramoyl-L-alanyl-D-glutamate--2,6-diaminopimelate ligase
MEVSSHALEMERVRGIDFDAALFTNLTRDHLDFHQSMESYFAAKSRLFSDYLQASTKSRRIAVVHGGDPRGSELLEKIRSLNVELWSYGRAQEWDVHPLGHEGDINGLRGKIRARGEELAFSSSLIGAANLENILGAVGVGFALGLSKSAIADGIARLGSVPGRLEKVPNERGVSVLVDYAHTPDALERVLAALRPLSRGRLIVLFGCGGDRDRGKRPLMGEIAARLGDIVVLTSDNPRSEDPLSILEEIEAGVQKTNINKFSLSDFRFPTPNLKSKIQNLKSQRGYFVEPDRRAAIRLALRLARAGDLVLLAGKGHEDYQILGAKRIHFDDREVAKEELKQMEEATGNRQ